MFNQFAKYEDAFRDWRRDGISGLKPEFYGYVEFSTSKDNDQLPREGTLWPHQWEAFLRVRVNQHFFRAAVLSAYDYKCCVTGLAVPELLVASHIVPWADDPKQRMNPRNGLCLNALHDRAFDRGLMWIDDQFRLCASPKLIKSERKKSDAMTWLLMHESRTLTMPRKFRPDPSLLACHRQRWEAV